MRKGAFVLVLLIATGTGFVLADSQSAPQPEGLQKSSVVHGGSPGDLDTPPAQPANETVVMHRLPSDAALEDVLPYLLTRDSMHRRVVGGRVSAGLDSIGIFQLLAACCLTAFSCFVLRVSVSFQAWAAGQRRNVPSALDGNSLALGVGAAVILVWTGYIWFTSGFMLDSNLGVVVLVAARDFVPGILLASLLPAAFGGVKFWLSYELILRRRTRAGSVSTAGPSLKSSLIGVAIASLNVAGSIATLVVFFGWQGK
jgi:hypothetical protein